MNIIDWLLQPTPDGATYLQAITLSVIAIVLLVALIRGIRDFIREVYK